MFKFTQMTVRQLRRQIAKLSEQREKARSKGDRWSAMNYGCLLQAAIGELDMRRTRAKVAA